MSGPDDSGAPAGHDAVRVDDELRRRLTFDDARLLAECDVDFHRVRGPGGQHRNKVSSAVRLLHRASGLLVVASERRSQHENKAVALTRLREKIAVNIRAAPANPHRWPEGVTPQAGRLRVSESNPALPLVVGLVLDAVYAERGDVARVGARMGVTGSSLTRFLGRHDHAWAEFCRLRRHFGLPILKAE